MAWQRAAVFAALFLLALGAVPPALAQDITLTSRDGSVEVSGNLLGFDGEFYRVDTQFGELTVDGSGVICDGPACPNLSDFVAEVRLSGASTMAERLLPALIEGFALRAGYKVAHRRPDPHHLVLALRRSDTGRTEGRFVLRITNTDEGFADLLANEADAALALREIRPGERDRAFEAGMGDLRDPARARVLALDAMVPVVAPDNRLGEIAPEALARVFAGEIRNWADLGGPDAPITLHLPHEGSGLAQAAEDYLLAPTGLSLAQQITRHALSSMVVEAVAGDPFGIGLASLAETGLARVLRLTGGCGFPLAATRRTIKTEDYPLVSPLFLYLPARRLPKLGREFLTYLRSPMAQAVVRRAGFTDQAFETIGLETQGARLANAIRNAGEEVALGELQRMIGTLGPMARLTVSFRFEPGSSRPDAQSRANIAQLAAAVEAGEFDGRALWFIGFSDGEGAAATNLRISRARAEAVRKAVIRAAQAPAPEDRVKLEVAAFGEALPMACDDSEWGRKVNRRVEVWVQ